MYQVWECYRTQRKTWETKQRLGAFADLEHAKSFADTSYEGLARIPESERMSVCVVATDGSVPYIVSVEREDKRGDG